MRESQYNIWVEQDGTHYVHNGVSGHITAVTGLERQLLDRFLRTNRLDARIGELTTKLVERRTLVEDSVDELTVLQRHYHAGQTNAAYMGLTVITSLGCNFDCPYCFEDKHPSLLKPEVHQAIVAMVADAAPRLDTLSITWLGGEPLLGRRQLFALSDELIAVCDAHDVRYLASITTNGWYLDPPTCQALAERRVTSAQVTIDGPPHVHDRRRPRVNGAGTFDRIVENLTTAADVLDIAVRVNLGADNAGDVPELLRLLADAGLAGRITVRPGHLHSYDHNPDAPSATYEGARFDRHQFALAEREFVALAASYGFAEMGTPRPVSTPCTAVRGSEIVIGSDGELYKCWDNVGDPDAVIGDIFHLDATNDRLKRWLHYDPFNDDECRSCIALPVCMGGCAHHALHGDAVNRCSTFRHTHVQQVHDTVRAELANRSGTVLPAPELEWLVPSAGSPEARTTEAVVVTIRPRTTTTPAASIS